MPEGLGAAAGALPQRPPTHRDGRCRASGLAPAAARAPILARALLVLLCLLLPTRDAAASLSPEDRDRLTSALELLLLSFDLDAAGDANQVLRTAEYGREDLTEYFSWFFATHPLSLSLRRYLALPALDWFDDDVHEKIQEALVSTLVPRIDGIFRAHLPEGLAAAFEADPSLRDTLWQAMSLVAEIGYRGDRLSTSTREGSYGTLRELVRTHPEDLRRTRAIDPDERPWLALFRAQLHMLMRDLEAVETLGFLADTGFEGAYAELALRHGVLVLDNRGLDERQLGIIRDLLDDIPSELLDLTHISVFASLGNPKDENGALFTRSIGASPGVNISPLPVEAALENPFPPDIDPLHFPVFSLILQHELNHNVDRVAVVADAGLQERKLDLIARAGSSDALQYLRSMFGAGVFTNAPQEFFASIANQYFSDSFHTLRLGLGRFDRGWLEPINQFLFFAEVYSRGGGTTLFYELEADGRYTVTQVPLARNERGHIHRLSWDGVDYEFVLDAEGNVLDFSHSGPQVAEIPVRRGDDDLRERIKNRRVSSGEDLELGPKFLSALRFEEVPVPRGATVRRAFLRLVPLKWPDRSVTLAYAAHAVDDSEALSEEPGALSGLPRTSARSTETPPPWTTGLYNETRDFASSVQEVVARSGWQAGNALTVLVEASARGTKGRLVGSYDSRPGQPPVLVVEYDP